MSAFIATTQLAVEPAAPGRAHIEIDPSWGSLIGVHGGLLAALAVRAAEQMRPDRRVRSSSTTFLRPTRVGPLDLITETVRDGRSLTTMAIELRQRDRAVAITRATLVDPGTNGESWDHAASPVVAPVAECVDLAPPPGVRHFEQAVARLDPTDMPFAHGEHARVAGHVRPLEAGPVDAAWLTMLLDWFPPTAFSRLDPPTGGVSVDYSVHVHRTLDWATPDDWFVGGFRSDLSTGGLAIEHGSIHSPDGHLLAESFHSRWTG